MSFPLGAMPTGDNGRWFETVIHLYAEEFFPTAGSLCTRNVLHEGVNLNPWMAAWVAGVKLVRVCAYDRHARV